MANVSEVVIKIKGDTINVGTTQVEFLKVGTLMCLPNVLVTHHKQDKLKCWEMTEPS